MDNPKQRVAVVTGGAAGIGAAIAQELGRNGVFVVTMDPVVSGDGLHRIDAPEQTTADKIVEAGGTARASDVSVTDQGAVQSLFSGLVDEFGSLDAVVNVAGIVRATDFSSGSEEDWAALLSVHLDGYLNVLRAALPIMAKAGHGRILGVTSGSGWRPANVGAYSCAKRAVAALTWQIGPATPAGISVNALSPIAHTRMMGAAAAAGQADRAASDARTGGLDLSSVPRPENLGPVGAYLAGDEFGSWCHGQVIFSGGSELALVARPHLLEVARSADVTSLAHALEAVLPVAFAPAEAAQATQGGSNPRYGAVFEDPAEGLDQSAGPVRTALIVTDDAAWGPALSAALSGRGVTSTLAAPAQGFGPAAAQIAAAGPLDAVIVALAGASASGPSHDWAQILDEHEGIAANIRTDAGWARAVSDYAAGAERPVRLVTITNATTAGGWSRAQASAQLSRAAHTATADRVDAFAISVESADEAERHSTAELAAHLLCHPDSAALSGAELVVASGWFGLRSHPSPAGTISYGGPAIPSWLDGALRTIITGTN